jgi:hypothetical protein
MCSIALFAGCSQQNMDMSTMKPPERAKELDQLEAFVGTWNTTGEMNMGGKTIQVTSTETAVWECDKRVLVTRSECNIPDMGKMSSIIVYTYDAKEKEFETHFFDSMGMSAKGEMTWCEKTKTWTMTGKGTNPMTGQMTYWTGNMTMPDSSTMNWDWTSKDGWGHVTESGKGTAKRS